MRHVRSILYALVLAPAAWVLAGVGLTGDLATRGRDGFAVETYVGLLMLLLAGAAYGILVLAPISPAGPTLAGVLLLGVTLWALNAPDSYADAWPGGVSKEGFDLSRPGYGVAALLAVPLLATALSARRWERYEPVVLPIIGQIGRARGSAAVAGTPIAGIETTVLGAEMNDPEPTTVLRLRGAASGSDSTTTVISLGGPTEEADERTTLLPTGAPDATDAGEEPAAADEPATEPIEADEEPVTEPVTEPVGRRDEPETVDVSGGQAGADDEATRAIPLPEDVERTRNFALGDPDRTDTVPDHEEVTRSLALGDPARAGSVPVPVDDGERTQVIRHFDPERTTVISGLGGAVPPGADDPDRTRDLRSAAPDAERTAGSPGEETEAMTPVSGTGEGEGGGEGEDTRRIPAAAPRSTVEPPGERTEVFRVPSIAAAEAPDFAEDPTGRIVPVEAGERPTATVADRERPADESGTIPIQRRPAED